MDLALMRVKLQESGLFTRGFLKPGLLDSQLLSVTWRLKSWPFYYAGYSLETYCEGMSSQKTIFTSPHTENICGLRVKWSIRSMFLRPCSRTSFICIVKPELVEREQLPQENGGFYDGLQQQQNSFARTEKGSGNSWWTSF